MQSSGWKHEGEIYRVLVGNMKEKYTGFWWETLRRNIQGFGGKH
jgi:hypothetical protein